MNWQAELEFTPVVTPDGKTLRTLDEGRDYLLKLPDTPATQHAAGALLTAAEQPNQFYRLCARIAVWKAIYGDQEPRPRPRKETWKDRRRKRR